MQNWKSKRLCEIGDIVGGATPSTNREDYYNGDIAWLTPKDLAGYNSRYISRGERSITMLGLGSCSAKILPKGSILFTSRAPIGYIAIAQNDICTNQGFKSIVPNADNDSMFLYYLLQYNKAKIEAMGSGTTFKEVSGAVMKNIEVLVPNLEEQKKISAILSSIDDKIELNNRINKNLEVQAQAIFKSWFVDFKPFQSEEFVDSELGRVPSIWKNGAISSICEYSKRRIAVNSLDLINYCSTENMLPNKLGVTTASGLPTTGQTTAFKKGDTLISNIRPYFKKILYADMDGGCSTDVLCFVPTHDIYSLYLYQTLYSDTFFNFIIASSKGTKMPRGDKKQIMQYPVVIPPENILNKFNSILIPMVKQISNTKRENISLIKLRDTLLPKLMSGETQIPQEV